MADDEVSLSASMARDATSLVRSYSNIKPHSLSQPSLQPNLENAYTCMLQGYSNEHQAFPLHGRTECAVRTAVRFSWHRAPREGYRIITLGSYMVSNKLFQPLA